MNNVEHLTSEFIVITQVGSPIGRNKIQRKILIGLGLNKISRTRILKNNPSIRGMVGRVLHLVECKEYNNA